MALEGRTESSSRNLHWAPLRSWNLFRGRVRSRLPQEAQSAQLPRSQSVRNNAEGGRVGSSSSRSSGNSRSGEASRKGGAHLRRDYKQAVREGIHRQSETSVAHDHVPLNSRESSGRRLTVQDRSVGASDVQSYDHTVRPSEHIAHHQQHHHHDHHHHHYHYHHLCRHPRRHFNGHQDQSFRMPSVSETASSSHANHGNLDQRGYLHDLEMPVPNNSQVRLNSRNAAIEARDRLDERLRGAAPLRDRHNIRNVPGGLLDDFSLLFEGEGWWSDEEIWELGIQDWLSTWTSGDAGSLDLHSSPEQLCPMIVGLSKAVIKNLPKEIFVPPTQMRSEETKEAMVEHEDCAVCLERFLAGQLLIRLPCEHRFHSDCLTPWLESRGQCPYCRSKVCGDSTCDEMLRPNVHANALRSNEDLLARMGLTNR